MLIQEHVYMYVNHIVNLWESETNVAKSAEKVLQEEVESATVALTEADIHLSVKRTHTYL